MFFYTSVFLASLALSFIVIWLYRSVLGTARIVWYAMLPSSADARNDSTGEKKGAPAPWGWKDRSKQSAKARAHPSSPVAEVPWGWPGNAAKARNQGGPVASGGGDLDSYLRGQLVQQASVSKTAQVRAGKLNTAVPWGW